MQRSQDNSEGMGDYYNQQRGYEDYMNDVRQIFKICTFIINLIVFSYDLLQQINFLKNTSGG